MYPGRGHVWVMVVIIRSEGTVVERGVVVSVRVVDMYDGTYLYYLMPFGCL